MSVSQSAEKRALATDEWEAVQPSHYPEICELKRKDLAALQSRLRGMRDKARDLQHQQRREMRGKSPPRGASPASGDAGSALKARVLASALKRVNREMKRPDVHRQVRLSKRALEMKRRAPAPRHPQPGPPVAKAQADPNFVNTPNETIAPSGALDAEGRRPVLERSRKVR